MQTTPSTEPLAAMFEGWDLGAALADVPSPALVFQRDRIVENLRRMVAMVCAVEQLRPHVKTHKCPAVVDLHLAEGIRKFKCATIAEAEMIARQGGDDVLVALPLVRPNISRLVALAKAYPQTRFRTLLVDEPTAAGLAAAAGAAAVTIGALVDVDVGMHRTGVSPADAETLFRAIESLHGVIADGFHAYDGHHRHADRAERAAAVEAGLSPLLAVRSRLVAEGKSVRLVAGGTPSFPVHAQHADREVSPGTSVLWDVRSQREFPDLQFLNAAAVLTRVISRPGPNRICLDLGHKAIASENPHPRVFFRELPDAKAVVHSEEHLVLETDRAGEFPLGTALLGLPWHICPTSALHQEAVVVEHGQIIARWPITARDRRLSL